MKDDLDQGLKDLLTERGKVAPDAIDRALSGIDALPERRATRSSMPFAAAAVVALGVIGLALAVLLPRPTDVATPSPSPSVQSQAPSPSAAVITPEPSPTVQPRPVWAMNLADHLDCDGPPSTVGMDVPAVLEPSDSAPTPEGVLPVIQMLYPLPASGFSPVLVDGHWALYRYLVDGRAKVHAVSTDQVPALPTNTAWYVVGLRACDPSEFEQADFASAGNTIWLGEDGDPVRTDVITSHTGPAHCGWERTRFHTDEWHLFTIPSGRAVFVRTADGTYERWPRAKEPIGCA